VNLKKDSLAPEAIISNGKLWSHPRCVGKTATPISVCVEFHDFTIGEVGFNIYDVASSVLEQCPPSGYDFPLYDGNI
jgi:hypothetical protein